MTLSAPTNATLGRAQAMGTILNDDLPIMSIADASIVEGNTGTSNLVFTVTLSQSSPQTVTVNYATANGTATAGTDYTAASGTLTFPAGTTTQTITVPVDRRHDGRGGRDVHRDTVDSDERHDRHGAGDRHDPERRRADTVDQQRERDRRQLRLDQRHVHGHVVAGEPADRHGRLRHGAWNGDGRRDYTTTSGTLTFSPGQTSKTISVPVLGDTLDENDETFSVNLSAPVNATLSTATGTGTIVDNDPTPTLSINSVSVQEGDSGTRNATLTVTLSAASSKQVTVSYATANGTATAGSDYTAASGTLTFQPGDDDSEHQRRRSMATRRRGQRNGAREPVEPDQRDHRAPVRAS